MVAIWDILRQQKMALNIFKFVLGWLDLLFQYKSSRTQQYLIRKKVILLRKALIRNAFVMAKGESYAATITAYNSP